MSESLKNPEYGGPSDEQWAPGGKLLAFSKSPERLGLNKKFCQRMWTALRGMPRSDFLKSSLVSLWSPLNCITTQPLSAIFKCPQILFWPWKQHHQQQKLSIRLPDSSHFPCFVRWFDGGALEADMFERALWQIGEGWDVWMHWVRRVFGLYCSDFYQSTRLTCTGCQKRVLAVLWE